MEVIAASPRREGGEFVFRFTQLNNFIQTLIWEGLVEFFYRFVSNTCAIFSLESAQVINVSNYAELEDGKPKDECQQGLKNETKNVGKKLQVPQMKIKKQSLVVTDKDMESKKDRVMEPRPQRENTSMVKYSVTTTPYLQR